MEIDALRLDADGHLADAADWSPGVAAALARADGLELDEARWWLIGFVRDHFRRYGMPPLMRMVVIGLRLWRDDPSLGSRDLYHIFPDGPIRLACKYGGLPAPESCI